jgi:hypothetical protein
MALIIGLIAAIVFWKVIALLVIGLMLGLRQILAHRYIR